MPSTKAADIAIYMHDFVYIGNLSSRQTHQQSIMVMVRRLHVNNHA